MRTLFRFLARIVGLGRAATGAWLMLDPASAARVWTGSDRPPLPLLVRGLGARDALIGAGLLTGRGSLRGWLAASMLADVTDLLGALDSEHLSEERRRLVVAAAGIWAGLAALALLGAGARREAASADEPTEALVPPP